MALLCNWLLVSFNHSQLSFVDAQMTEREPLQIMAINLASQVTDLLFGKVSVWTQGGFASH